jgi:hypothetical protein
MVRFRMGQRRRRVQVNLRSHLQLAGAAPTSESLPVPGAGSGRGLGHAADNFKLNGPHGAVGRAVTARARALHDKECQPGKQGPGHEPGDPNAGLSGRPAAETQAQLRAGLGPSRRDGRTDSRQE